MCHHFGTQFFALLGQHLVVVGDALRRQRGQIGRVNLLDFDLQGQQGQPEQLADPGRRSAVQIPRITEQIRVRKTDEVPRPGEDSPKE